MATVKTEGFKPTTSISPKRVIVSFHVHASTAALTLDFVIEDQGDVAANDALAREKLRTFLQEALPAV